MTYYDADMIDQLEGWWRLLGQEDIGCGLPGFYSSELAATCLSRDLFLLARGVFRDNITLLNNEMNTKSLDSLRDYLREEVQDMLCTGTRSYGPSIWHGTPSDETQTADPSISPTSHALSWSSEEHRKNIFHALTNIVILNIRFVKQLNHEEERAS
ncbi:hypothetical protein Q7P37_001974 [Cladosporium fusiforme]